MNQEDQLQLVRQRCIDTNSQIVALNPGCLIDLHCGESYGLITIHQPTSVCKKHKKFREECIDEENGCSVEPAVYGTSGNDENFWTHTVKVADIKPYQILGRPIRLADVLLVICVIRGGLEAMARLEKGLQEICTGLWNLRRDNLEDQSPETIAFIAELLK